MESTTRVEKKGAKRQQAIQPKKNATIAVVGLGYVGLPLALRANHLRYPVIGVDINTTLVETLKKKEAPSFITDSYQEYIKEHTMEVSADPKVLARADTYIVCVPTPVFSNHKPDLGPLIAACEMIGPHIQKNNLVVIESTINPGVCNEIVIPILENISHFKAEEDFLFAYCPERINPGDPKWDLATIPRVLGAAGPKSEEKAYALYTQLIEAPVHRMKSIKEAEAVKITENSFRDINIAFVNELAMSFKKLGIDVTNVLEGASTKPFGFMAHFPGCGVGGHCIPVDPYYLISYAKQNGFTHRFLETARSINNYMPHYTVNLVEDALREKRKEINGAHVALLGLAYKKGVSDVRESPAFIIRDELINRGAYVQSYDPYIPEESEASSLESVLRGADAAVIATDHPLFLTLTPQKLLRHGVDIVVDGRNCLNKEMFTEANIVYHGIGK